MAYTPPKTRKTTIHGVSVEQTELQSNWYTPVDERVKIAEQADPALVRREGAGYHVVSVQFVPIGERWAYHCLVEYPVGSGVVKPGTDFIDLKDASGVAKAETSAIGRALGLHGIAIETSIASADEMARVGDGASEQQFATSQPGAGGARAESAGAEHQPWTTYLNDMRFRERAKKLGYHTVQQVEELIAAACGAGQTVTRAKVRAHLEALEAKARQSATARQAGEADLRQAFREEVRS